MRLGSSKLIQASAGTGKTYSLSGHFIGLILQGEDPSTILASTFTRKAAGEILERIFIRLAKAYLAPTACKELAEQTGLPSLNTENVGEALLRLIDNQHLLKVSTLDSFSSTVARLFAEELGLASNWRIQDQSARITQLTAAISGVCASLDSIDVATLVTTLKRGESKRSISRAIQSIIGDLLGIFQESDFSAWDWLKVKCPHVSNALPIIDRIKAAELPKTKAGEINKSFLKAQQKIIELAQKQDWDEVIAQTMLQNASSSGNFSTSVIPEQLKEALVDLSVHASSCCLSRLGDANRSAYGLLFAILMELELIEESSGELSFDRITRRIVQHGRSIFSDEFYYRLDTKIHHILLDEFQDTSLLQWQLLEPLIEEKLASSDANSSFFCVGDGKQAIYGWRGGSTAIFDSIPIRWVQIEVETKELSYRSNQNIMDCVNAVFSSLENNPALLELVPAINNWKSRFKLHSSARQNQNEIYNSNPVKFEAVNAESDSEQYADAVFKGLSQLLSKNPDQSIGILVRSNEDVSYFMDLGQSRGFDLSTQGGTPLTRFSIVTSLLALLSLINNPGDSIKQYEVNMAPWENAHDISTLLKETTHSLGSVGLAQTLQNISKSELANYSNAEKKALEHLLQIAVKFELSSKTVDLPTFINLVESSSVEGASTSKQQVLTIHKSKGLEFDSVIIPDLSWNLEPKGGFDYLIERSKKDLHPLKVSLSSKKELRLFSPELSAMAQQTRQDNFEEALSLIYVAITRAKSSLLLYTPNSAILSDSLSAAKLISSAVDLSYADSDQDISIKLPDKEIKANVKQRPASVSKSKIALQRTQNKLRGLGRVSPSSFVKSGIDLTNVNNNEFFGTLIHKLFSLTAWIEDSLSKAEQIKTLLDYGATEQQAKEASDAFDGFLQLKIVSSLMKKPAPALLEKIRLFFEKSFAYREENVLIQGRIDRLVIEPEVGTVVDYKVGKTPPKDSEMMNGYLKQIDIYKKAASLLFPKCTFTAKLLFLGDGNLVEL